MRYAHFKLESKEIGCASMNQTVWINKFTWVLELRIFTSYVPYYDNPTMKELIPAINEIVKYGLQPNLTITDKEKLLEKELVKIYNLYFDIKFDFDEINYPDFDKSNLPNIRQNIESNFKDFGFYKTTLDINDIDKLQESAIGDAIDDLNDITIDLLEIKWRIENNSLADGLWFFELMFYGHIQQHLLDLLNYMKQKKWLR